MTEIETETNSQIGGVLQTESPEGDGTGQPDNGAQNPNREAARYRTQLREAESLRDALQTRLDAMNRREVERLAAEKLAHGSDVLTLSGNEVQDYLDDDGNVDPDKVSADVAAILAERPGLRATSRGYDPSQGHGSTPPARSQPTFGYLLRS